MASIMPSGAWRTDESDSLQPKTTEVDLSLQQNLDYITNCFNSDWFESASTEGSVNGTFLTNNGEEMSTLPLPRRLAAQIAEIVQRWGLEPEDEPVRYQQEISSLCCSASALDSSVGDDYCRSSEDCLGCCSDTAIETLFHNLYEPLNAQKPRYIRRENPSGHRKWQTWIKASAAPQRYDSESTETLKDEMEGVSEESKTLATNQGKTGLNSEVTILPAKLPVKFRHGRKRKIVYKGPICYYCGDQHHIRDCGRKKLKGKKSKKCWKS